jgi:hypothetical protein
MAAIVLSILGMTVALLAVASILSATGIAVSSAKDGLLSTFGAILLVAVLLAGFVFVGVRYLFFLPLAAVLSPDQHLGRSHDLSAGNFWPIFTIALAATIPSISVGLVLSLPELLSQLVSAFKGGFHWPSASDFATHNHMSVVTRIRKFGIDFVVTLLDWPLMATAAVFASEAFNTSRNAGNPT